MKKRRHLCNLKYKITNIPTRPSKLKLIDLLQHYDNVAIVLGNGINYSFYKSTAVSWSKLVADLWNNAHPNEPISESFVNTKNISMTETAEMSETPFDDIRTFVAEKFSIHTQKNEKAYRFLEYFEKNNIPIITTNYDDNIVKELSLSQFYTSFEHGEILDPRFQWGRYYSKEEIPQKGILKRFAVWNAHGTIDDPKSMCFSLSDYYECYQKAYEILNGVYSPFYIKSPHQELPYEKTWINILLNKSICIIGLSLDENETFLRWLLMMRYRYMQNYLGNSNRHKGWYLYTENENMSEAKKFFLKSVNIRPIKCKSYNAIFNSL